MDPTEVGKWIRERRLADDISQKSLAESVHIGRNVLRKIENGEHRTPATAEYIRSIFRALGMGDLVDHHPHFPWAPNELCPHGCYVGPPVEPLSVALGAETWFRHLLRLDQDADLLYTPGVVIDALDMALAIKVGSKALAAGILPTLDRGGNLLIDRYGQYWMGPEIDLRHHRESLGPLVAEARRALEFADRALYEVERALRPEGEPDEVMEWLYEQGIRDRPRTYAYFEDRQIAKGPPDDL